jgi:hypothetical protein
MKPQHADLSVTDDLEGDVNGAGLMKTNETAEMDSVVMYVVCEKRWTCQMKPICELGQVRLVVCVLDQVAHQEAQVEDHSRYEVAAQWEVASY